MIALKKFLSDPGWELRSLYPFKR